MKLEENVSYILTVSDVELDRIRQMLLDNYNRYDAGNSVRTVAVELLHNITRYDQKEPS